MLWGHTLRSPHPSARIRSIDIAAAVASPGVHAVLLADDVPGSRFYGLEFADQPVLAWEVVRYVGEPVAVVAAEHPELARRAADGIVVDYEPLPAVTDMVRALDPGAPQAWRKEPYLTQLRRWAAAGNRPVIVFLNKSATAVMPTHDVPLGVIAADERLVLREELAGGRPRVTVAKVKAAA